MTDDELEALYWAAFEAEIRAVFDAYGGPDSETADASWKVVRDQAYRPSIAGLRALYDAGTARMSVGSDEAGA